jgi:SNF2 family DNA or RNA helicase
MRSKTANWPHQERAQLFLDEHPSAMLACAMGTGKSKIIVDRVCALAAQNEHINVLILCPKAVMRVWPREFEKHGWNPPPVIVLEGTTDAKARTVRYLPHGVFVVNYESAWRTPLCKELSKRYWDVVVCDESHKIKTHDSRISLYVSSLLAEHRYCLTGTPTPNGPLDIFAQFRFLDSRIFGSSWWSFRRQYAQTSRRRLWTRRGWVEFEDVIGYRNLPDWQRRVASLAIRVDQSALRLPEPVITPVEIDLEPATRRHYDTLRRKLEVEIREGKVTPANAGVMLLRLQQIASGHVGTDDGTVIEVGREKRDAVAELLDGLNGEKVAVFCRFRSDLAAVEKIAREQGKEYGEISGARKDGLDSKACWNPDKQVLGVQIQAGGTGVDLTAAHYAIYYSVGYSYSDYVQSLARLARPGQQHTVNAYHLIARNTADEKVWHAIETKQNFSENLLEMLT